MELTVWDAATETPIAGNTSDSCPSTPNGWTNCIVTFTPESGGWPGNSSIGWTISPPQDELDSGWGEALSGSFSTTDWIRPPQVPAAMTISAEMTEWRPIESSCDSTERILVSMSIATDPLDPGTLLEFVEEPSADSIQMEDGLPEPLVVANHLVRDDSALEFAFEIGATEEERCFSVWAYSHDGTMVDQYAGPCLQWGEGNSEEGSDKGCASTGANSSLKAGWLAGLLVLGMRRRRR